MPIPGGGMAGGGIIVIIGIIAAILLGGNVLGGGDGGPRRLARRHRRFRAGPRQRGCSGSRPRAEAVRQRRPRRRAAVLGAAVLRRREAIRGCAARPLQPPYRHGWLWRGGVLLRPVLLPGRSGRLPRPRLLPRAAPRFGAPGDFAQAYVLAHELGHHVQNLLGIDSDVRRQQEDDPSRRNDLSVRLELQADCLPACGDTRPTIAASSSRAISTRDSQLPPRSATTASAPAARRSGRTAPLRSA